MTYLSKATDPKAHPPAKEQRRSTWDGKKARWTSEADSWAQLLVGKVCKIGAVRHVGWHL